MSSECLNDDTNARLIGKENGEFSTGNTKHEWDREKLRGAHKVLASSQVERDSV